MKLNFEPLLLRKLLRPLKLSIVLLIGALAETLAQDMTVDDVLLLAGKITPVVAADTIQNAQLIMDLAEKGFLVTHYQDSISEKNEYKMVLYRLQNPETEDIVEICTETSPEPEKLYNYRVALKTKNLSNYSKWLKSMSSRQARFRFQKQDASSLIFKFDDINVSLGMVNAINETNRSGKFTVTKTIADPKWCYLQIEDRNQRRNGTQ